MKKFLIQISLFLLPIVAGMYVLDYLLSNSLKRSDDFAAGEVQVWNAIYEGKAETDLAVYGSSRALKHFNSPMMADSLGLSAYNFGIDGYNFHLQYFRHLQLLKYNPAPKYIVLSVDIFSFIKRKDLFNLQQFLPYMTSPTYRQDLYAWTSSYEGFSRYDYYLPLVKFWGRREHLFRAIKLLLKPESRPARRKQGFWAVDKAWNGDFERAKAKMEKYEVEVNPQSLELFRQFITDCKKSGTQLIFVYSPEYYEGQEFIKNRDEVMQLLNGFAKEYSIPFLDYSQDPMCRDKSYFYNATHLNKQGADVFTAKFITDLKPYLKP